MSELWSTLDRTLGPAAIAGLSRRIGAEDGATATATGASLPLLVDALARNAGDPRGAVSLEGALERDHDGSILDRPGRLIADDAPAIGLHGGLFGAEPGTYLGESGDGRTLDGDGILGHLFGARREAVTSGVSRASGLDRTQADQLLALLAPLVLGALGRVRQRHHLDRSCLCALLVDERTEAASGRGFHSRLLH